MLRLRIISAIVMLAVVAIILFVLPPIAFTLFVVAVAALGMWEWANLAGIEDSIKRIAYAAPLVIVTLILLFLPAQLALAKLASMLALLFWLYAIYRMKVQPVLCSERVALACAGSFSRATAVCAGSGLGDGYRRLLHR